LGEIRVPTLVITGDSDTVVPTEDASRIHDAIGQSELVIIGQAGHLPQEEQPAAFISVLEVWLVSTYE
jgi:pimeloyl-ACP methyl ester carboxylesterase